MSSRPWGTLPISPDLSLRSGADAYVERFDIDIEEQDDDYPSPNDQALARQLTSRTDFNVSVWADVVVRPLPALEVISRSVRYIGNETFDSAFDRRHVLNLAASYDFGRGWRLGGRVMFYTGAPMTIDYRLRPRGQGPARPPNEPDRPDTLEDILQREELRRLLAEYVANLDLPERLPAFFRLDMRLEKRWSFERGRWLSFTVEVLNATASKETTQYECTFTDGCAPEELGPIVIPSIGLEGGF